MRERRKKVIISFVHQQTCDALSTFPKDFPLSTVFFSAILSCLSYIFCHWFLVSLFHAKENVFSGRFRRKILPKCEIIKDSYSLLKQKFSIASSFSNKLLCCLSVILFKEAQGVMKNSPKDMGEAEGGGGGPYALCGMTNIL